MKPFRPLITLMACLLLTNLLHAQLQAIDDFGNNPGRLDMYLYTPAQLSDSAPVVLVMHGCGQEASNFAEQTGWNKLADLHGFYVIYAGQRRSNNALKCFNWFLASDNVRGEGEAQSLAEMVSYVKENLSDPDAQAYVCGLSAGAAMTSVLLATYPDVFSAGGIWAGVPYLVQQEGNASITPQAWGDKVRQAAVDYDGDYPKVFICQGTADAVTEAVNAEYLLSQWTNVHATDQVPEEVDDAFLGNDRVSRSIYHDQAGEPVLALHYIADMGHGIAIDPGDSPTQGGAVSAGAFDVDFHSTYWMAHFFGLIETGPVAVSETEADPKVSVKMVGQAAWHICSASGEDIMAVRYDMNGRVLAKSAYGREVLLPARRPAEDGLSIVAVYAADGSRRYARIWAH